jgi:signal transduction histidine kinase
VTELAWLSPRASSLIKLGHLPSSAVWNNLRNDPGAVLLLLGLHSAIQIRSGPSSFISLLNVPELPASAARHLVEAERGFVDWADAVLAPIYQAALTYAHLAEHLAVHSGQANAESAWICGLLAPLGWFAVCAVSPARATACLADPSLTHDPIETQLRHWGADCSAIARRLARRWNLPGWVAAIAGHLPLPESQARTFGAEPALFHLTRLAICLARGRVKELGLGKPEWAHESARALGLSATAIEALAKSELDQLPAPLVWESPYGQPLLLDVLTLAAENRRLRGAAYQPQLEWELDELQRAYTAQVHTEDQRLQAAKLSALAEFAAGAGHEINNPLAVISGQAQHLLNHERAWFSADTEGKAANALSTIIGQTKRVHALLRDLIQFARPAPPRKTWFDLPTLLGEVAAGLEDLAFQRLVGVEVGRTPEQLLLLGDAEQVRMALTCVLKNAIEAAPAQGWARLRIVEPPGEQRIEILIEDSGAGPAPEQRDHLFDPFYSGRSAGRGRGLGLPIAWRLLRQQGGDIRLDPSQPGPTCFVVTLPRAPAPAVESSNHERNGTTVEC